MIDSANRSFAVAPLPIPGPAPVPKPPDRAPHPAVAAHPFAEILRQNRPAAATPNPLTTPHADDEKAGDRSAAGRAATGHEATPPESAISQRDATQAKARSAGASRAAPRSTAAPAAPADASTRADETHAKDDAAKDAPAAPADATPSAATIASAQAAAAQRSGADAETDDHVEDPRGGSPTSNDLSRDRSLASEGAANALPFGAGASPLEAAGTARDRRTGLAAADEASSRDDAGIDTPVDAAAAGSFAGLLAESKASQTTSSRLERTGSEATAQPSGVAGHAAPNPGTTVVSAALPTPVRSPDFAAAFGLQVSVLAKDGVQRAELHLNPAEMGPVSIHITLDGSQARVEFGADVAATRHAIESGLPELASALRDAGFTLAGGGVAQHSQSNQGDRDEAGPGSNRNGTSGLSSARVASVDVAARRLTQRVAAGGVDLYA